MTRQEHIAKATWAFNRMLDHVGTAMYPGGHDPGELAAYSQVMDDHLAAAAREATEAEVPPE